MAKKLIPESPLRKRRDKYCSCIACSQWRPHSEDGRPARRCNTLTRYWRATPFFLCHNFQTDPVQVSQEARIFRRRSGSSASFWLYSFLISRSRRKPVHPPRPQKAAIGDRFVQLGPDSGQGRGQEGRLGALPGRHREVPHDASEGRGDRAARHAQQGRGRQSRMGCQHLDARGRRHPRQALAQPVAELLRGDL